MQIPKQEIMIEDYEVENEHGNEDIEIIVPFDPNKIKVTNPPYSMGQLIDDLREEVIDFDTEFQRLPGLWSPRKKSRFIESLLLKLPVPAFYFFEKEENDWEVVDGLQRVSTIKQFVIDKTLQLVNLEFLTEYNSKTYDELPITLQKRISRFSITVYLIEKGTPDDVKFNLFSRINQGGLELKPQEIRHAIHQGKPAELIADLVRGKSNIDHEGSIRLRKNRDGSETILYPTAEGLAFVLATSGKIQTQRMQDRDFATRFVSFYLNDYSTYEPDMDTFLNKGMAKIKTLNSIEIDQLKSDFKDSMNTAVSIFGDDAFRKRFSKSDNRMPINKALFDVLSVLFAKLLSKQRETLINRKTDMIDGLIELHQDTKFVSSISQGTAQKDNVDTRFRSIESLIKNILKSK